MSSSNITSANNSMESCNSSLHRSGLNMSVGDTRSIVLALQTLQDKIRRLEQDRNHHQDQYEKALQAHEAYKHDMEHQLEQERKHHRQREQELQEMVQRATAEKTKLQGTLDESRKDLGLFRTELEEMLQKECDSSKKRENALTMEMENLRREIEEQKKKHRVLLESIEELKVEKEAVIDTNHHLEQAIQELLQRHAAGSIDNSRITDFDASRLTNGSCKRSIRRGGKVRNGVGAAGGRSQEKRCCVNAPYQAVDRRRASAGRVGSTRPSYRDPTHSSLLRDARNGGADLMLEIEGNSLLNTRPLTRGRTVTPLNCSHFASVDDSRSCEAMMEVCNELQEEVRSLHQQYKETIERAAAEDVSPDIVTGTLSRITALMDRKSEQIRLIKEAQRDLKNAGAVVSDATRSGIADRRRRSTPVGADKSTKRNLIVNELRSLVQRR